MECGDIPAAICLFMRSGSGAAAGLRPVEACGGKSKIFPGWRQSGKMAKRCVAKWNAEQIALSEAEASLKPAKRAAVQIIMA